MKTRLICLFLSILMILSVALTGCSRNKTDDEAIGDVTEEAAENAVTLTMWVVSNNKVCNTEAEFAEYLEKECGNDANSEKYQNMIKVTEAYNKVEEAFTKITKAKFKVNVDLFFYTEDEYYDRQTEALNTYVAQEKLAEKAAKALKKVIKDEKAAGNTDTSLITKQFYVDHPEYAKFASVDEDDEEETTVSEEETVINKYGISELKYPATEENQVDIIYLGGYDRYTDYIENGYLADLTEELAGSSKKLNDYISTALLSGVQVDGATYAIPNNVAIGKYNYMMLDKELFDKYYHNISSIKNITDCKFFLSDIVKHEPEVNPINATYEECMSMLVWYWDIDFVQGELNEIKTNEAISKAAEAAAAKAEEKGKESDFDEDAARASGDYNVYDYEYNINKNAPFSIMGVAYPSAESRTRGGIRLSFDSLFTTPKYRQLFVEMMEYKYNGYFNEVPADTRSAISFFRGDASVLLEAEEKGYYTAADGKTYYPIVAEYPEATEDDLYGNMFAVTSYSKSASRAMKIITYLNTNSDLRNVLQYGVENENYELIEDEKFSETNTYIAKALPGNLYSMSIEKTGNEFIAYPSENMSSDVWEAAKIQNRLALIDPLLGFSFNKALEENDAILDVNSLKVMNQLTNSTLASINEIEEDDDKYPTPALKLTALKALVDKLNEDLKVTKTPALTKIANKTYDASEDAYGESPFTVYYNWLTTYGYDNTNGAVES